MSDFKQDPMHWGAPAPDILRGLSEIQAETAHTRKLPPVDLWNPAFCGDLDMRIAVDGYGGRITFCEPTLEARESTLDRIRLDTGASVVHPYNDERVIAGQGTAALELRPATTLGTSYTRPHR